jgi:serine O-acetyltransferase
MTFKRQRDSDLCKTEVAHTYEFRKELPAVVEQLVLSCDREDCFDHLGPEPISSRDVIIDILARLRSILYPGYFINSRLDQMNLPYYFGQEVTGVFEILAQQITLSLRHECLRYNLPCIHCEERGQEVALIVIRAIPSLRVALAKDVRAAYEDDPAAKGYDEIIFSYPGLYAITVYRVAHLLHEQRIPLIPRIMTEYAHSLTGIDIHPGARIGEGFFIDHGTGVVIGETTDIGNRVRLYQGVTLGALSVPSNAVEQLRTRKRHPTIEDDVIIYSGATILGGETVIGARSIIGGNVWLTESVPPDTRIFLKKPPMIYRRQTQAPKERSSSKTEKGRIGT